MNFTMAVHVVVKIKARPWGEPSLHFTFAMGHSSHRMKHFNHTGISIMHRLGNTLVDGFALSKHCKTGPDGDHNSEDHQCINE